MQPAAGKKWQPYLARADELEDRYPLVAYFCRLYVADSLLKLRNAPEYDMSLDMLMINTLDKCELIKPLVQNQLEDGAMKMEEFCLGIFANADKSDRDSPIQPPDIALAGRFYVSSLFFDVLTQFHSASVLPPDLEEKRKYAKYRTMQIRNRKAIDPQPDQAVDANVQIVQKVQQPKTVSGFQYREEDSAGSPKRPVEVKPAPRPPKPVPVVAPVSDNESSPGSPMSAVPRGDAMIAKKKLQMAVSAIDFADYNTAKTLCGEAFKLLNAK